MGPCWPFIIGFYWKMICNHSLKVSLLNTLSKNSISYIPLCPGTPSCQIQCKKQKSVFEEVFETRDLRSTCLKVNTCEAGAHCGCCGCCPEGSDCRHSRRPEGGRGGGDGFGLGWGAPSLIRTVRTLRHPIAALCCINTAPWWRTGELTCGASKGMWGGRCLRTYFEGKKKKKKSINSYKIQHKACQRN